ncbi:MAG: alpha-hydroxy-acid oxidizing protein [Acidobacteria bacterium]|nr:alpha-hydroxy-acid oxidizing protein [Acidobacteriota bacterium]
MSGGRIARRRSFERAAAQGSGVGTIRRETANQEDLARAVPAADLVNVLEFEAQAWRALSTALYARIAGGDRLAFDRMTLRPRVMVPTTDLDLSVPLFGDVLYAPIVVAPIAEQRQFHPDGERATVEGAAHAHTPVVVTSRSSVPIETLAAAGAPLWFQVFATDDGARARAQQAVRAGCRVVCVTIGTTWPAGAARASALASTRDWDLLAGVKRDLGVPVIVKGVMTPDAARIALQQDVQGIVVSNYGGLAGPPRDAPIQALSRVVEAVGGRVPVLLDGSIRRGTDVLKALALGAAAVLVGRPIMWALAAYGDAGVTTVLELLQFELARYMCMAGAPTVKALEPSMVRIHKT